MFVQTQRLKSVVTLVSDLLLTLGSLALAVWLRHLLDSSGELPFYDYVGIALLVVPIWAVALDALGCYENRSQPAGASVALRVLVALAAANAFLGLYAFFTRALFLSRLAMLIFVPLNYVALLAGRGLINLAFRGRPRRLLVVGTDEAAARLGRSWCERGTYELVGYLGSREGAAVPGELILGQDCELEKVLRAHAPVDEIVAATGIEKASAVAEVVRKAEERGLTARIALGPSGVSERKTYLDEVFGEQVLTFQTAPTNAGALAVKRLMDIVGALVGLAVTVALFPLIAAAIKLTSRGPVLFRQVRVGVNGRPFVIYKFRTMVDGAEAMKCALLKDNIMEGPMFKALRDPRVTLVGRFLRRTSLDEFPQFWNVLKGEMSLVGTRPPTPDEVACYGNGHFKRLAMKPGITGIWQTSGRNRVKNFEDIVRMDVEYARRWSLWLDVKLLLKTVPIVLLGRGAC